MKIIEDMLSEVNKERDALEKELNELNGIVEEKRRYLELLSKASDGLRASLELHQAGG